MKILIIGNGGREHALAWKAAQSPLVTQVFVAPGNAGTALEPSVENINIPSTDVATLAQFAEEQAIGLTIVGPEAALAAGIVDYFQNAELPIFGPTQAAAQLESSKKFSKDFMAKHHIPTAQYASFTDNKAAKNYVEQQGVPIVIKADGLAAGKGVVVATSMSQALQAIDAMLQEKAGERIVIEEFLTGEEASFIVMVDGEHILPLATSQDHKTRDNGDQGPNTGGMGAYSPAPIITPALHELIMKKIIAPTVKGMAASGIPYTGFLYAGLMISSKGEPKVLEFNCRLGDPETQPLMLRLKSDLIELCLLAINKKLNQTQALWDKRAALGVVLATKGYPQQYPTGEIIHGLPATAASDVKIFHAGTALAQNQIVTAGGRVLCVTALGDNVSQAQMKAYQAAKNIQWNNIYYRTDIGYRAIKCESITQ